MQKCLAVVLLLLAPAALVDAVATEQKEASSANPIRRVVTMLQMMQNKVRAEGEKEEELFEKFMCYCETSSTTLGKSIEDAKEKIPQVESDIKEAIALKAQLDKDIADAKTSREEANAAMEKATAIRDKENGEFAAESAEDNSNIAALGKAIAAIEKGMGGGFLQTSSASVIRKLVENSESALSGFTDYERTELTAFLEGKEGNHYAPASGEIVGMLKQMKETMEKDAAEAAADEAAAVASYEELMAAKKKEVAAATAEIEQKLARVGEVAVEIVMLKEDLEDTTEALAEDTKFLADLAKNCETKKKEWAVISKTRSEELLALADCIKMLNDDDALDLFGKTLPSAAASLLQIDTTATEVRQKALSLIQAAQSQHRSVPLDLVSLALRGKKVGFEKVIKLIDDMVVTLGSEQDDDDKKKDYCLAELDTAEDKKKETERDIKDMGTKMEESKESIATLADELKALEDGIAALDKSVVVATKQRKDENAEYTDLMSSNAAAKQLIEMVKNRMNKFYNPKMYKPPPKRELTEEERITLNMGGTLEPTAPPGGIAGTGITALAQKAAPPPPPAAPGPYKKKGEESNGVIAMMDGLIAELDKETTEAEVDEKDAQGDYEKFMQDCTAKRAGDTKVITEKSGAKAELETELETTKDAHKAATDDLLALNKYISELHGDCDWLLENFDLRKEARANEIDALKKAKAVLNGANFSLLQTGVATVRRHE
jgi:septal ring factor EnvC (AmiA/AmiB activator)